MDSKAPTSRYYLVAIFFLVLCFKSLNANWTLPFAFENFGENSRLESQLSLFGDAQLANAANVSYLQLSGSVVSSAGRVMYREPIKLFERNPINLVSFATEFVFSLTGEKGDGLAFVLVPNGYPRAAVFTNGGSFGMPPPGTKFNFIAVEFDALMNKELGDVNDNHVGIDVNTFVSSKMSNLSSANLVLKSGEKLQAWVDYEASSQRLEVRLTKLGGIRPVGPLLSYPINFSRIWGSKKVFVGLSSSSGNSLQKCNVYSWSLQLRTAPHWMHSEPLDPNTFVKKEDDKIKPLDEKRECAMRIFTALVFGTGCGALGAIVVLFLWIVLGSKVPVVPAVPVDYSVRAKEVEYEKTKGIDKAIQEATKS